MKRPNAIILFVVCLFVIIEILVLRPSSIEVGEQATTGMFDSIENTLEAEKKNDEVGYTIEGFRYTAVEGEIKQWEMIASQAVLYQNSKVVHATNAKIKMFDDSGNITFIEGMNAYFYMGKKDLDLSVKVKVTFPDGFWVTTEKAHYSGITRIIGNSEDFHGQAPPNRGEIMKIWGRGFEASKMNPIIKVKQNSKIQIKQMDEQELTTILSDFSEVNRFTKFALFWMATPEAFVQTTKGSLFIRSRRQQATYDSKSNEVEFMTALKDVLIREMENTKAKQGLKYATSQRADFHTKEDKIILSGFPSAYQENDTLTGETITIYRKRNIVEVMEANALHEAAAFSERNSNDKVKE